MEGSTHNGGISIMDYRNYFSDEEPKTQVMNIKNRRASHDVINTLQSIMEVEIAMEQDDIVPQHHSPADQNNAGQYDVLGHHGHDLVIGHHQTEDEFDPVAKLDSTSASDMAADTLPDSPKHLSTGTNKFPDLSKHLSTGTNNFPDSPKHLSTGTNKFPDSPRHLSTGTNNFPDSPRHLSTDTNKFPDSPRHLSTGTNNFPDSPRHLSTGTNNFPDSPKHLRIGTSLEMSIKNNYSAPAIRNFAAEVNRIGQSLGKLVLQDSLSGKRRRDDGSPKSRDRDLVDAKRRKISEFPEKKDLLYVIEEEEMEDEDGCDTSCPGLSSGLRWENNPVDESDKDQVDETDKDQASGDEERQNQAFRSGSTQKKPFGIRDELAFDGDVSSSGGEDDSFGSLFGLRKSPFSLFKKEIKAQVAVLPGYDDNDTDDDTDTSTTTFPQRQRRRRGR